MELSGGEMVTLILGVVAQLVTLIVALRTKREVGANTQQVAETRAQIQEAVVKVAEVKQDVSAVQMLAQDFINTDAGYQAGERAGFRRGQTVPAELSEGG